LLRRLFVLVLIAGLPAASLAQPRSESPSARVVPDFRLVVLGHFDADALAEFNKRVQRYAADRERAERGGPLLRMTDNPDEIIRAERELTKRIRAVRKSSDRGQIFIPRMEAQIRAFLDLRVDPVTLTTIMEDGPGEFDVDINETYPKDLPLATMPASILLQLPDLPRDVEYRFVGRHLILRDVRANMVIDKVPYAIVCEDCLPPLEDIHDPEVLPKDLDRRERPSAR
jgi:hypothetical protein